MITAATLIFVFFLVLYLAVAGFKIANEHYVRPRTLRRLRNDDGRNSFHGVKWNWDWMRRK